MFSTIWKRGADLKKIKFKNKTLKNIFIFLCLLPTMICFCIFYLYPIVTVFITSFAKWDYTNLNKMEFYPISEMFTNYKYIFKSYPYFIEALRNSCIWALCGFFIHMPIAVLVAIILAKTKKGWVFTRNVYIMPTVISSAAMGLIFLQIYNPKYGVINQIIRIFKPDFVENILLMPKYNMIALTCVYIFFTGSIMIMILGQIFAIPTEIYEAAMLDRAIGWRREWYITLPLIKDTLKTVSIIAVSAGFLLYNEVFFLTNGAGGTKSISFIIRELAVVSPRAQYARANAVGTIQILGGMLIILLINLIFRDWSRKGELKHEKAK